MKPFDFIEAGYKAGDRVFSVAHGWGKIAYLNCHPDCVYPLEVIFEQAPDDSFTTTGLRDATDKMPALFPNEFAIPDSAYQRPRPDLKIDDRVLVRETGDEDWWKRHFAEWTDDGHIKTFLEGSSWTACGDTIEWDEWKLPDADPETSEVKNDD